MRKCDELLLPDSCVNRAQDDEFIFALLGRDMASPATIRFWVHERIRLALNKYEDAQLQTAWRAAEAIEAEQLQKKHGPADAYVIRLDPRPGIKEEGYYWKHTRTHTPPDYRFCIVKRNAYMFLTVEDARREANEQSLTYYTVLPFHAGVA